MALRLIEMVLREKGGRRNSRGLLLPWRVKAVNGCGG
jgi:hypothetical protein